MLTCPVCDETFIPKRSSQRYCSRRCQCHATRPKQNSDFSPTKKRKNYELHDLALRLAETYYTIQPCQRLGILNDWINQARAEPGLLREVLSNRTLLRPNPDTERWKFWRRSPEYLTITQVANRFCLRLWGFGVVEVVHNRCPEPPTGEVFEERLPLAA